MPRRERDGAGLPGLHPPRRADAAPTAVVLLLLLAGPWPFLSGVAHAAAPWSLSMDQRRDFLHGYAPIIFKQAFEGDEDVGHDWITNYDFDRDDAYLANNGESWSNELTAFVREGSHPHWRIRPTLYTAIVEFMTGDTKSVLLLYHVYHAMDGTHTHDWERIAMRIDDVQGGPGSGERVRYAVITQHGLSEARVLPDPTATFLETGRGRRLLVWQAPQKKIRGSSKGELHFVRSLSGARPGDELAAVRVSRWWREAYHYVFVPESDPEAVGAWGARSIDGCDPASLASGATGERVPIGSVKGVTYELQDIADVFPSQWVVPGNGSWVEPLFEISLAAPLTDEDGAPVVPMGRQSFRNGVVDLHFGRRDGRGYISKNLFWGTYLFDRGRGGFLFQSLEPGPLRDARCRANGRAACRTGELWQHDLFVHDGIRARGGKGNEHGRWLPGDWFRETAGGFDGRWARLFADAPEREPSCPTRSALRDPLRSPVP